jgi:hypothetical protein
MEKDGAQRGGGVNGLKEFPSVRNYQDRVLGLVRFKPTAASAGFGGKKETWEADAHSMRDSRKNPECSVRPSRLSVILQGFGKRSAQA